MIEKEKFILAMVESFFNKNSGSQLSQEEVFRAGINAGLESAWEFDCFEAWKAGETHGANYISPFAHKDEAGSKRAYEKWKDEFDCT